MQLGHLLTRSGLTYPEVSSKVYHDSFCQLESSITMEVSITNKKSVSIEGVFNRYVWQTEQQQQ